MSRGEAKGKNACGKYRPRRPFSSMNWWTALVTSRGDCGRGMDSVREGRRGTEYGHPPLTRHRNSRFGLPRPWLGCRRRWDYSMKNAPEHVRAILIHASISTQTSSLGSEMFVLGDDPQQVAPQT